MLRHAGPALSQYRGLKESALFHAIERPTPHTSIDSKESGTSTRVRALCTVDSSSFRRNCIVPIGSWCTHPVTCKQRMRAQFTVSLSQADSQLLETLGKPHTQSTATQIGEGPHTCSSTSSVGATSCSPAMWVILFKNSSVSMDVFVSWER